MATEAQRLIGISLSKIAQSRAHRGGVSLHKNLLVATVLQKARYVFMEEAYNMVHYHQPIVVPPMAAPQSPSHHSLVVRGPAASGDVHHPDDLVALTAEEAPSIRTKDKENQPPDSHPSAELTYLDLDLDADKNKPLRDRTASNASAMLSSSSSLKRRRAVSEWETEEAVQSILPKRSRGESDANEPTTTATASIACDSTMTMAAIVERTVEERLPSSTMEIDRITSLVSIFSFGVTSTSGAGAADSNGSNNKLPRSVSTPDLCSAQAKEASPDETLQQQRQFLAMTV